MPCSWKVKSSFFFFFLSTSRNEGTFKWTPYNQKYLFWGCSFSQKVFWKLLWEFSSEPVSHSPTRSAHCYMVRLNFKTKIITPHLLTLQAPGVQVWSTPRDAAFWAGISFRIEAGRAPSHFSPSSSTLCSNPVGWKT